MIDSNKVKELVETFLSSLQDESVYLVEVRVSKANNIIVELGADKGLGIDLCVKLNKYIENAFDRDEEDFELEVGSAGLTSPFKVLRQYVGAVGSKVEMLLKGGKKEKGVLQSADETILKLLVQRLVKPEGAKRKIEVEEVLEIKWDDLLQCKRIIEF